VKSVLVTGATSPIGTRLIRSLLADTRVSQVLAVDMKPEDRLKPELRSNKRLTYLQVDLRRPRRIRNLIFGAARDLGVELVIHLQENTSAFSEGRSARAENVEALRNILAFVDRHPTIRRLVVRSHAAVYRVNLDLPVLVTEDHPLELSPSAPQYVRDRVEADLTACAQMGLIDCEIVVLRCAEAMAPGTGSQLYDYLNSKIVFRNMGFDPMVNLASTADTVRALELATHGSGEGVFNVPGADTLPLSEAARRWGAVEIPSPAAAIRAVYGIRHFFTGSQFRYGANRQRMHFGLVLDGTRAARELGYAPSHPIDWPVG